MTMEGCHVTLGTMHIVTSSLLRTREGCLCLGDFVSDKLKVTRAARAAEKAGLPVARVEVEPANGKIIVVIAKPGAAEEDTPERIISQL